MKQLIIAFSTSETKTFFLHNVWFKNYPYLPHGRDFSLDPPPPYPSGNSSQASYIYLNFGPLRTPHPQEFPIPSVGRKWIFSGTVQINEINTFIISLFLT